MDQRLSADEIRALYVEADIPVGLLLAVHSATYLRAVYRALPGDMVSVLLYAQLVAHALSSPAVAHGLDQPPELWTSAASFRGRGTNIHSLALVTEVPRETVRRKIQALVERGWVTLDDRGLVQLAPGNDALLHALPSFTEIAVSVVETGRQIESILRARRAVRDAARRDAASDPNPG